MNGGSDNSRSNGAPPEESISSEKSSAEQIAEEWAGRITGWLIRGAARAKEEAEDIWADAQAVRRRS